MGRGCGWGLEGCCSRLNVDGGEEGDDRDAGVRGG